ncbi:MAG: flagellar basal body rod C-terminal domain-containing protein [Lachnospiraceae bacterium]|nr:flagellar basal body rod C-terminal domain-containing protein [Lachnospiraceae bacterium]
MIRATFAGFTTALSAIRTNQKKLDVTGQNLANMNTEGYTRQSLQTSSINYDNPTSFYMNENDVNVGFGVSMDKMTQMRDQFLDVQYRDQNSKVNYNSTVQEGLNNLSGFLDESNADGIRKSFDNIHTALTNMQDPSKVNDPVYEGQLRSRMEATADLLNNGAVQIQTSMKNEYQKIDGSGSSENGYTDQINQLLADIGSLNVDIKKNQLLGNPALELVDERNQKINQLSNYVPIQVSYFTEKYQAVDANGQTVTRDRGLNYNSAGVATGKSGFPEDLKIELVYTETKQNGKNPVEKRMTLVNGSDTTDKNGNTVANYGKVSVQIKNPGSADYENVHDDTGASLIQYTGKADADGNIQKVRLQFDKADSYEITKNADDSLTDSNGSTVDADAAYESMKTDNDVTVDADGTITDRSTTRFSSGSLQASLDLLADTTSSLNNGSIYRSYDYYMKRLDTLANTFAHDMNVYNMMGTRDGYQNKTTKAANLALTDKELSNLEAGKSKDGGVSTDTNNKSFLLLVNNGTIAAEDTQTANKITAATISVSQKWVNGSTKIGTYGDPTEGNSSTDTALNMLDAMTSTHAAIGHKSYADEMNSISTYVATDSYNNDNALKTNQAVLKGIADNQDQISGVSLDEEAANMMTYVSSYNAAARLMTTLDSMLDTLLGIAR